MEKVIFISLVDENDNICETKFYVLFNGEKSCYTALSKDSNVITYQGTSYTECLLETMKQLPKQSKIKSFNRVHISNSNKEDITTIKEEISLVWLDSIEDYHLKFELECSFNGTVYKALAFEDFSIALQKLKNLMQVDMNICAYCKHGDFRSDGLEDLRHGWYCFREFEKSDLPWFQREEEFRRAIPNLDAFHWCPMHNKDSRTFI